MLAFGPGDELLVSAKLQAAFSDASLVGLSDFSPVRVVTIKAKRGGAPSTPSYVLGRIARSRAAIDDAASGVVRERATASSCPECRLDGTLKRARAIVLEPDTCSGEDLFFARGLPGTILTSDRFRKLAERHRFENWRLVPAAEYSFDFYPRASTADAR